MFNTIKSRISEKLEKIESNSFQKKIEKDLMNHFTRHSKQIISDLKLINESPQLLNAIEIGKAFRALCDKIGRDNEIGNSAYLNFRNLVRQKDREVESIVDGMKYRFDYSDSDKFRVRANRSTHDIDQIFSSLKSVHLDLMKLEEEKQLSRDQKQSERLMKKEEREEEQSGKNQPKWMEIFDFNDADYYRSRGEEVPKIVLASEWAKSKIHPERVPQNIDMIRQFRQSNKPEILEKFKRPLTQKQETSILSEYLKINIQKLHNYEQKGFFNHTMQYCDTFLRSIEEVGNKLRSHPDLNKIAPILLPKFREQFVAVEDWRDRVKRKYEIPTNHNRSEGKVDQKTINAIVKSYYPMRENFILAEEDKRILKHILGENKEQLKAEKKKERALQREETNERKAEERARKEKEREIQREEKNRLKAEEAARKEKQAQIRKEAQALPASQETAPEGAEKDKKNKKLKSLIENERTRLKKKAFPPKTKPEDPEKKV